MLSGMKKPRRRLQKARRRARATAALFEAYYQSVKIPLLLALSSVKRVQRSTSLWSNSFDWPQQRWEAP